MNGIERTLAAIRRGPHAEAIADDGRRRARLFEALGESRDPVWHEIGRRLRDGTMSLRELANTEAYADHLLDAARDGGERLPQVLRTACGFFEAKAERAERERTEENAGHVGMEPDADGVIRGVAGRRARGTAHTPPDGQVWRG